jgi:hypothetical protein
MKSIPILLACLFVAGTVAAPAEDSLQLLHREFPEAHRFIFYAVLEGAYEEGLSGESVSAILGGKITDHFVISCPICTPAYEALVAYRDAPEFTSKKLSQKGFGTDLPPGERPLLEGPVEKRRKLVRTLISRWIEARFSLLNLPEAREHALRESLRRMSEEGSKALESLKKAGHGNALAKAYADWEFCPSCSGATLHDPAASR